MDEPIVIDNSLELQLHVKTDTLVARFLGEMGVAQELQVRQHLNELRRHADRRCLLDLSAVAFMTSVGLMTMLAIKSAFESSGGELCLCRVQPAVRETFRKAGLEDRFTFFDSVEQAQNGRAA